MLILIIITWWLVLSLVSVLSLLIPFHFFSEDKTNQKFYAKFPMETWGVWNVQKGVYKLEH